MLSRRIACRAPASLLRRTAPHIYRKHVETTRKASFEAGERNTGHISAGPNEGVLFLNNLFPLSLQWLFRLPFIKPEKTLPRFYNDRHTERPESILANAQSSLPTKEGEGSASVVEVLPRVKEGGAFIKFSHSSAVTPLNVQEAVSKYLREKHTMPWWVPFQSVRVGLVVGRPWVEDLYRLPSERVRVEFLPTAPGGEVADLSQEQLYSFFRPYGKLGDIEMQPNDSKILPKYAYLDFTKVAKAIMAKNCMHGYTVSEAQGGGKGGTLLRLTYEKKQKARWILDWITNHPRIVIPVLAALIAGLSVTIFDPIRTLAIKQHITRSLYLEDTRVYRWFKRQADALLTSVRLRRGGEEAGMQAIWDDRKENIEQIQTWLMETADTFIVIQGARGSGKKELVDQTLKEGRRHKLVIDCKPIQEARGDTNTINAAANEVGYKPVFSWMNSISGLVDLAAQGTTGVKTGFSETLDNQLIKIWTNTATALKEIALDGRKSSDKDASLSDDEYLEAHPESRPVVIIDNFLHKAQETSTVYDKLAEWAARLSTSNIAHVIFLTHDVSFSKSLSKALPDRVFRQISLSDCSQEVAKRYVVNHLDFDSPDTPSSDESGGDKALTPSQKRADLSQLDEVLPLLGGRLTDLEFLARRVKAGETPSKATDEIVEQSASEILKMFLFNDDRSRQWTAPQAWLLIRQLARTDSLRYNEVLLSDAYGTKGEAALSALEQAELISVQSANGRPFSIRPGRPVYHTAFARLAEDKVLRSRLDLAVLGESVKAESASIDKCEQELHLLGELPKQPAELNARVAWLLGKIQTSQAKIEGYEREAGALKKILMSEY